MTDLSTGARSLAHGPEDLGQDLAPALTEAFRHDRSVAVPRSNGEVFINMFAPTTRLVVIGAVHVAQALAPMARALGYEVVIVDPRAAFATAGAASAMSGSYATGLMRRFPRLASMQRPRWWC